MNTKLKQLLLDWLRLRRSRSGTIYFIRQFSNNDIKRATDNFRRTIDGSSHSAYYKAHLHDGSAAMVKEVRYNDKDDEFFYEELQLLGCLHHRHIISLTGFSAGHKRLGFNGVLDILIFTLVKSLSVSQTLTFEVIIKHILFTFYANTISVYFKSCGTYEQTHKLPSTSLASKFVTGKCCDYKNYASGMDVVLFYSSVASFLIVSEACVSTGFDIFRFLVFENIENGSLKEHLNDPLKTPLSWRLRLQIVVGVAAALEYLHSFCDPPVYHVSISSSTVLLDENFNAKLCDVGLLCSRGNLITTSQPSRYKETQSRAGEDVIFQLGLLILEVVTGQSSEAVDLIKWVQGSRLSMSIHKMIDPDLGNGYDSKELKYLLTIARLCVKSVDKPTAFASQIFRYLQKKVHIT